MEISDVEFEMELAGVDASDIESILALCKSKGFNSDFLDDELLKKGYPKVFTVDYDEYDSFDDDEYYSIEKFPHKNHYQD
ncbi:hypothetical protein GJV85_12705 [Sulfurimonas aquatica]|uniref:Uncharacterized protein n=1 Tax=Sulfurimonas aquatica TaxID=2672570 RepID=A0A975B2J1_9BACT|nr:hypothetical protein [Sulfurimonas aquatica]QSZ42930.1 hypothetical protein GJV85_12705 [Sulfurimonas aquatica]